MLEANRPHPLVLLVLSFAIGLIGCSDDNGGGAGAGGTGGAGGSGGGSVPLRILVTNDDGVGAEGIDALVEALRTDPNNILIVSAPAQNSSGSGDRTVNDGPPPPCAGGTGDGTEAMTASGYDDNVWSVDGCPADSVLFALANLYTEAEPPHVVLSGINEGQNVANIQGALSQLSGTVGAAKTAACSGVPALASSQGDPDEGDEYDYEAGVAEVLDWLAANRSALAEGNVSLETITSINIPSCAPGTEIRGREMVPLRTQPVPDYIIGLLDPQDCASTRENPQDDVEAFFNGFVSITPVPSNSSNTCDKLAN